MLAFSVRWARRVRRASSATAQALFSSAGRARQVIQGRGGQAVHGAGEPAYVIDRVVHNLLGWSGVALGSKGSRSEK